MKAHKVTSPVLQAEEQMVQQLQVMTEEQHQVAVLVPHRAAAYEQTTLQASLIIIPSATLRSIMTW